MSSLFPHAAALEAALKDLVGDLPPVTMTLDYGAEPAGPVTVQAAIDRTTRTLVFARAEAIAEDGALALTASAVFRKPDPS
ncbi:MAG: hypothetical protein IT546_09570 [Caulobacteraceae bacterium]|nr:hypothetical protein [Caulobacteraceae bacterium]